MEKFLLMWGKNQIIELNTKAVKRDRDYEQCRINSGTMIGNDRDEQMPVVPTFMLPKFVTN